MRRNFIIRKPAVAGIFYPADASKLESQLDQILSGTKKLFGKRNPVILIVPHAGYSYSGRTAAWGYKQLDNSGFSRVIILGVSHYALLSKSAIMDKGSWQTPLGKVAIDEVCAKSLLAKKVGLEPDINVFKNEHSLEVQLPFLQKVLKNFSFVPILLCRQTDAEFEKLSRVIFQNTDKHTLLIISSDLSHYPSYATANEIDKKTVNAILKVNEDKFLEATDVDGQGVETAACASDAIRMGISVAKKLNAVDASLLYYENSGDVSQDRNRVVGYVSIGFYLPE